jgi:hypothetical protein
MNQTDVLKATQEIKLLLIDIGTSSCFNASLYVRSTERGTEKLNVFFVGKTVLVAV